ncbi:MAG: M20/M25/M40 family metallo-hydrolase [Chthoniobacterales bacterium]
MHSFLRLALVALFGAALSLRAEPEPTLPPNAALDAIKPDDLLQHIKVLASDEYEGRAPGSKGEELTVKYLTEQFKALGLKPGNPNGSYTQEVPLAGITTKPTASFVLDGKTIDLKYPDDYVASSARLQEDIKVADSDMIFVGYGVVAPEFGWDDYKGVDVKGKTIVMLINDPAIPDPADPAKLDPKMFKGRAMTYYGRWSYKYEIAAEKGAAAAVIIHETEPAAYPYSVVKSSWSGENFEIDAANKNMDHVQIRSWITLETAKNLLSSSGLDFEKLKKDALSKDFHPVPLKTKANFALKQAVRSFKSRNVVGKIEGSDAKLKDEWILYTAHWDHLGKHADVEGDNIYNGAADNASGVATILEIARAHLALPQPTKRSVLFMATTAEEAGLLGAKYYAEHPLYPLEKTLADINVDGANLWGKATDIEDISDGRSTLDDMLMAAAKTQNRVVKPDSQPEKGSFFRADHFEFSKLGVPALYPGKGMDIIGKPGFGVEKRDEYVAKHYHQPSDEVNPEWNLGGAVDDAQLLFTVGYEVANGDKFPEWNTGTEFKAKREEMLAKKKP